MFLGAGGLWLSAGEKRNSFEELFYRGGGRQGEQGKLVKSSPQQALQ